MLTSVKEMGKYFYHFYKAEHENKQNMEYVSVPELCRQKLLQYADSFQELARSLEIDGMAGEEAYEGESGLTCGNGFPGESTLACENGFTGESGLTCGDGFTDENERGQARRNMQDGETGQAWEAVPDEWTDEQDRSNVLDERRVLENRILIQYNFNEMANIMTRVADELARCKPMEENLQKMLRHALRTESIFADQFCYYAEGEQTVHSIGITLYTEKKEGRSAADVADMLSVLLDRRLQLSAVSPYRIDEKPRSFVFVDETAYVVLTGFCKVKKEGQQVSGDHYSILESEKGHMTLLLSDGTGSGESASRDSEKALDLMEKFLEAGYDIGAAAAMVNVAFYAGERELSHPTLDLCELNLYDASCSFLKVGGAVSFLKHGDKVEQIRQGTLPLGIFRSPEMEKVDRQLEDGDYVILMTDGVLDALPEENYVEALEQVIAEMSEIEPGEIAEKLMELALHACEGHIRDDMTVLVAGIWENAAVE